MNSADEFKRDDFLRCLSTISCSITNADDLLRFCKYLKYKLDQKKALDFFFATKRADERLSPKVTEESEKIFKCFEEAYENDPNKDQTFEEFLKGR